METTLGGWDGDMTAVFFLRLGSISSWMKVGRKCPTVGVFEDGRSSRLISCVADVVPHANCLSCQGLQDPCTMAGFRPLLFCVHCIVAAFLKTNAGRGDRGDESRAYQISPLLLDNEMCEHHASRETSLTSFFSIYGKGEYRVLLKAMKKILRPRSDIDWYGQGNATTCLEEIRCLLFVPRPRLLAAHFQCYYLGMVTPGFVYHHFVFLQYPGMTV